MCNFLKSKNITTIGTLQINRQGIPKEIKDLKDREQNSYEVYWEKTRGDMTLHSYAVKTKSTGDRNVFLLSTLQPHLGVTKNDKKKPAIYKVYDFTKVPSKYYVINRGQWVGLAK